MVHISKNLKKKKVSPLKCLKGVGVAKREMERIKMNEQREPKKGYWD